MKLYQITATEEKSLAIHIQKPDKLAKEFHKESKQYHLDRIDVLKGDLKSSQKELKNKNRYTDLDYHTANVAEIPHLIKHHEKYVQHHDSMLKGNKK